MNSDAHHKEASPESVVTEVEQLLLGSDPVLSADELASRAGLDVSDARRVWRALGFAQARRDEDAFRESDVSALHAANQLITDSVAGQEEALNLVRAIGRNADRLATWHAHAIAEVLQTERERTSEGGACDESLRVAPSDLADASAFDSMLLQEMSKRVGALADILEPLVVYAWRRHLAVAMARIAADAMEDQPGQRGAYRTIGFADLVSFTEFSATATERELSYIVQHFEAVTSEIINDHGGRLVKTIGDEALFSTRHVSSAVAIASDLVEALADDPVLPSVRVGLGSGWVLLRLGDVYGTTVNRAHRLVEVAMPNTVVVDHAVADAIKESDEFQLFRQPQRPLRGLGSTESWVLRRVNRAARRSGVA